MKALYNSLKYAFGAWNKYSAYIDSLDISWQSTILGKNSTKKALYSELKLHLDNLAMEFKVAAYGWEDMKVFAEDFRAIFPNFDSIRSF